MAVAALKLKPVFKTYHATVQVTRIDPVMVFTR